MSEYLKSVWDQAQEENHRLILSLVEPAEVIVDCGCDEGGFTVEVAEATGQV